LSKRKTFGAENTLFWKILEQEIKISSTRKIRSISVEKLQLPAPATCLTHNAAEKLLIGSIDTDVIGEL